MMASAACGLYPYLLPATGEVGRGWTVERAAAPAHALALGLAWWVPGMALVAGYFLYAYRHFAGKVSRAEGEGY